MRGCTKGPKKIRKPGRGCTVVLKPGKRFRRRRPPFKAMRPLIRGIRRFAR